MTQTKSKKLIAYCGLYCGDCPNYKGKIAGFAQNLLEELKQPTLKKFIDYMNTRGNDTTFKDFDKCSKFLGVLANFRCEKVCRDGGRSARCEIRKCCLKNNFDGCWQCDDFVNCAKMSFLNAVHGEAYLKNLCKLKRKGIQAFLSGKSYW